MKFVEKKYDLFKVPSKFYLAHCIGADAKMGAGIAIQFVKHFPEIKKLRYATNLKKGTCIKIERVFNLITKEKSRYKPTYEDFTLSLQDMCRRIINDNYVEYLAMPRIGCGLDGLEWRKVSEIICETFKDIPLLEIVVCRLED